MRLDLPAPFDPIRTVMGLTSNQSESVKPLKFCHRNWNGRTRPIVHVRAVARQPTIALGAGARSCIAMRRDRHARARLTASRP